MAIEIKRLEAFDFKLAVNRGVGENGLKEMRGVAFRAVGVVVAGHEHQRRVGEGQLGGGTRLHGEGLRPAGAHRRAFQRSAEHQTQQGAYMEDAQSLYPNMDDLLVYQITVR